MVAIIFMGAVELNTCPCQFLATSVKNSGSGNYLHASNMESVDDTPRMRAIKVVQMTSNASYNLVTTTQQVSTQSDM